MTVEYQYKRSIVYGFGINDCDRQTKWCVDGKAYTIPEYAKWASMLQRAYSPKLKARSPTYTDVYCNEEWKYFSNFEKWLNTQSHWQDLELDKDILVKGNKEYGPDTCCFVPGYINTVLMVRLGKTYLPGVDQSRTGAYQAKSKNSFTKQGIYLGSFATELEAHAAWQMGKAFTIECAINKYASEPYFRTDVADALMSRVWNLRLSASTGGITIKL